MCEYCEKVNGKIKSNLHLYRNLPIIDDFTEECISNYGIGNPLQYIRELKNKYQLITELANEDGDVLALDINYCPMCGRKLNQIRK